MIIIACNTVAAALAGDTDFLPVPFAEALTPAVHGQYHKADDCPGGGGVYARPGAVH